MALFFICSRSFVCSLTSFVSIMRVILFHSSELSCISRFDSIFCMISCTQKTSVFFHPHSFLFTHFACLLVVIVSIAVCLPLCMCVLVFSSFLRLRFFHCFSFAFVIILLVFTHFPYMSIECMIKHCNTQANAIVPNSTEHIFQAKLKRMKAEQTQTNTQTLCD